MIVNQNKTNHTNQRIKMSDTIFIDLLIYFSLNINFVSRFHGDPLY